MEAHAARRTAGIVFFLAILALLASVYVALVYHGDLDAGAALVVQVTFLNWIIGFAITLTFLFVVLLILILMPVQRTEPVAMNPNDRSVQCSNCDKMFLVADSGERPLWYTCPHCGTTDQLTEPAVAAAPPSEMEIVPQATAEAEPMAAEEAVAEPVPSGPKVVERMEEGEMRRFLVLRCSNCQTNFEVPYTDERPLVTTCTNCGRRGILHATPAPRMPKPSAPAGGRAVVDVEGIGPAYAQRLGDMGINTTDQLMAADTAEVAAQTGASATQVDQWKSMVDLMRVDGIGPQYSELLVRSGVGSVDQLKQLNPAKLVEMIEATNEGREVRIQGGPMGPKMAKKWISAAQKA